jgi:hypothetical protein
VSRASGLVSQRPDLAVAVHSGECDLPGTWDIFTVAPVDGRAGT